MAASGAGSGGCRVVPGTFVPKTFTVSVTSAQKGWFEPCKSAAEFLPFKDPEKCKAFRQAYPLKTSKVASSTRAEVSQAGTQKQPEAKEAHASKRSRVSYDVAGRSAAKVC
eukprot:TRINITY_DN12529_c0_g1_i1.p2 TRINITY_DN12529_c0_g1~~TRINITY_DN12529_c0_g1_i1.p2  ORF type:complete len:111 (+),score=16.40 TRINITY_DN12529_c0_g1_i1:77-409(+)